MLEPGGVRVRELVDQGELGPARQQCGQVHLLQCGAAVIESAAGNHLQVFRDRRRSARPWVPETDHRVAPRVSRGLALLQHPVGLADTGGHPEEDLVPAGHSRVSGRTRRARRPAGVFPAAAGVLINRNGYSASPWRTAGAAARPASPSRHSPVAFTTLIVYPLKRSHRRSPWASCTCWRCCWSRRSGGVARDRHGCRKRARLQLLPHRADRAFHDRRRRALGALGVFFVAAIVASELAQRARQQAEQADERRREADLCGGDGAPPSEGRGSGRRAARRSHTASRSTLGLPSAAVEMRAVDGDFRRLAFPLREGSRQLGTLLVPGRPAGGDACRRLQERVVPSLEALLGAAIERDQLLSNRVEAAALRRTDVAEDRAPAGRLARPALAADRNPERGGAAAERDHHRGGAQRAGVVITQEARRLSRLIDNLLDLSRLEAGAAEPQREWCDLREVIHSAVEELGLPRRHVPLQLRRSCR